MEGSLRVGLPESSQDSICGDIGDEASRVIYHLSGTSHPEPVLPVGRSCETGQPALDFSCHWPQVGVKRQALRVEVKVTPLPD